MIIDSEDFRVTVEGGKLRRCEIPVPLQGTTVTLNWDKVIKRASAMAGGEPAAPEAEVEKKEPQPAPPAAAKPAPRDILPLASRRWTDDVINSILDREIAGQRPANKRQRPEESESSSVSDVSDDSEQEGDEKKSQEKPKKPKRRVTTDAYQHDDSMIDDSEWRNPGTVEPLDWGMYTMDMQLVQFDKETGKPIAVNPQPEDTRQAATAATSQKRGRKDERRDEAKGDGRKRLSPKPRAKKQENEKDQEREAPGKLAKEAAKGKEEKKKGEPAVKKEKEQKAPKEKAKKKEKEEKEKDKPKETKDKTKDKEDKTSRDKEKDTARENEKEKKEKPAKAHVEQTKEIIVDTSPRSPSTPERSSRSRTTKNRRAQEMASSPPSPVVILDCDVSPDREAGSNQTPFATCAPLVQLLSDTRNATPGELIQRRAGPAPLASTGPQAQES
eukprot:TRINITY_DN21064_c0_g1_i1.p1 TRINITY_DN21064_c0_g1~~TRINITY_DN21064_c0_g1_i1.p1  ORF type:complete len:451 (+),score=99.10 TRINITY_DN21064_c0_g1_i1:25-1353(+)